jgi:hypothetical protein
MKTALTVLIAIAGIGCAPAEPNEEVAHSSDEIGFAQSGEWTVFPLTTGPNPAAKISGSVRGFISPEIDRNPAAKISGSVRGFISPEIDRSMLTLSVKGLPANKTFGAHLHATSCADNKGSGHYQHDGTAVNADNEVWLDITTDASGKGRVIERKPYAVAAEKAKSVVVHANPTDPTTGKAGDKLACVDVAFVEGASGVPGAPASAEGKSCSTAYQCTNGACECGGDKAGTQCAAADDCERTCSVCK